MRFTAIIACLAARRALHGLLLAACLSGQASAAGGFLRVCADPDNMPFSNDKGEGFENKLAELIAVKLGQQLRIHLVL